MATILQIDARADVTAAAADLSGLGDSARNLGTDLDATADKARTAGTDLTGLGDGADNVASKSSQATGALGALAGGLEAVGLEKYAAGLQAAAIGTDVMSGAGDALNLVAETQAGKWVVATAASVAHKGAMIVGAAATGIMTGAQTALNAVLALNPIMLIVIGVLLLVGALILAYNKSETFRAIVDGAFSKAKEVIEGAGEAISGFIDWLSDLPDKAGDAWEKVKTVIGDKIDDAKGFISDLFGALGDGADNVKDAIAGAFSAMFQPILDAIGWVQDLIDKISNIDMPDINPFNGRFVAGDGSGGFGGFGGGKASGPLLGEPVILGVNLTVAPQDKDVATRDLVESMREYFARRGQTLSITGP